MKRHLFLLLSLLMSAVAWSQRVTLTLQDEPLASALRQIDHAQHERNIIFVLNDLDSLRVTRNVFQRSALDAVTDVCEGYPILITEHEADILVEYIRPPVHLLPNTLVTRRQIRYDADGYTVRLNRRGMNGMQLLALLPDLTAQEEGMMLNGEPVQAYYLNGERLTDAEELRLLPSEMIEEVRVSHRTHSVHLTLRRPADGGYYGSVSAETDRYEASSESQVGGVWYARYGKTSLFNRFGAAYDDVNHDISQSKLDATSAPDLTTMNDTQHSRLMTTEQGVSNRFSLTRELTRRSSIGFSYYIASLRGMAKVRRDNTTGFIDFSGSNRHTDQELTLRYETAFGPRDTRVEALLDYYSRQTTSKNVSLYGAGVGTEMGEAPSISMWKYAAEIHHPMWQWLMLHGSQEARYLFLSYDPQRYLSNFEGSSAFLHAMEQRALILKATIGISAQWGRMRMEAGITEQLYTVLDKILDKSLLADDIGSVSRSQGGLYPYVQMQLPLDEERRHQLSLAWLRELEDLPYAAMSPAVRWSDAFNYSIGNRKLRAPELEQLRINASGWDGLLSVAASYCKMHREIFWQSAISSGQTDIFYTHPINLPTTRLWRLQAGANLHPTEHWQMKLDAQWQLRYEDTTIADVYYHTNHWRQQYACSNLFSLRQGWSIQLDARYQPTYHIYDRTYHGSHCLQGEVQKSLLSDRLQCALTFRTWGTDRSLDRQIGMTQVSYRYGDSHPHIGIRATWRLEGGRTVKVGTVEGAQHYHDIKDN